MTDVTGLLASAALSVALVVTAQAAQAAVPKIKGKYTYHSVNICQIGISVAKDVQGDVVNINTLGSNGNMSTILGTTNFTGAAAYSGLITHSAKKIEGSAFYIGSGPGLANSTETGSGAYSNTATTLTLGEDVYTVRYSNIVGDVAKTVSFIVRLSGNRCFESGTLTREN